MISKQNFIKYINKLNNIKLIFDNINEAGKSLEFFSISYVECESLIISILEDAFDDKINGWLQYYACELDYGSKCYEGCITMNGKNIRMSNAGELYDVLIDNIKNKINEEKEDLIKELEKRMRYKENNNGM